MFVLISLVDLGRERLGGGGGLLITKLIHDIASENVPGEGVNKIICITLLCYIKMIGLTSITGFSFCHGR